MPRQVTFARNLGLWFSGIVPASWHRMTFDMGSQDDITFRLAGRRYAFNVKDPVWIQEDSGGCPPGKGVHKDFKVSKCSATELTVTNLNQDKVTLRYQLNIVDTQANKPVPIDPILENGGRGFI